MNYVAFWRLQFTKFSKIETGYKLLLTRIELKFQFHNYR